MTPERTLLHLVIQSIAGVFGAHLAAIVAHEYRFGFIGHTIVGLIAGFLGGFFLQRIVMTTVDSTGDAMPMTALEAGIYQARRRPRLRRHGDARRRPAALRDGEENIVRLSE